MSSIRKLKRYSFFQKKQKTSSKMSLGEIVFYIGIATIFAGFLYGIYNYCVYTAGMPEHTIESKGGSIHYAEEAPGDPARRDSITAGLKISGFGVLFIVLSMAICIIEEVMLGRNENLNSKTGRKRHL